MPAPITNDRDEVRRRIARLRRRIDGRLRAGASPARAAFSRGGVGREGTFWAIVAAAGIAWWLSRRPPGQLADWLRRLIAWATEKVDAASHRQPGPTENQ